MKNEINDMISCLTNYPVVLYGLGQLGNDVGLEMLGLLGINATFACDKTFERISDFVSKNSYVVPISYSELLQRKDDLCVFVCVGAKYIRTVCDNLSINKSLHIVSVDDIVRSERNSIRFVIFRGILRTFLGVINLIILMKCKYVIIRLRYILVLLQTMIRQKSLQLIQTIAIISILVKKSRI